MSAFPLLVWELFFDFAKGNGFFLPGPGSLNHHECRDFSLLTRVIIFYSSVHSPTVDRINLRDLQGDVLSLLGSGT
jgi:hypothetical protein